MFRAMLFTILASLSGLGQLSAQPPSPPAKPAEPPKQTEGDKLVETALTKLKALQWMAVNLRHEVFSPGMKFEAKGRCVMAPGRKVRYELETNSAGATGWLKQVSDGQTFWRVQQWGEEKYLFSFPVAQLEEALKKAGSDDIGQQVKEEMEGEYGFGGIRPLLSDLHKRITFTKVENATRNRPGRSAIPVYQLDGEWTKAARDQIAPPASGNATAGRSMAELWEKRLDFLFQPRKCRLYLSREAGGSMHLPVRLEWFGPTQRGGADELLTAIDFSDFVIAPPEKPETWAREFQLSLDDEDKKKVQEIQPSAVVESRQKALERRKEQEQRSRTLRPLDPGQ